MTSEVRAAAEALHEWATDPNALGLYGATKHLAEIVSAEVLASVRPDDGEALTDDRLRRMLFSDDELEGQECLSWQAIHICRFSDGDCRIHIGGWWSHWENPTVGQLRQLASALGLPLAEASEGEV